MTKAEMEYHRAQYLTLVDDARAAEMHGFPSKAIELAVAALPFIDGMMQYERKYAEREFESIDAIEIVLKLAPVLFDLASLDAVGSVLKAKKRIDRNATDDLAKKLDAAVTRLWSAHRLWNHLEQAPLNEKSLTDESEATGERDAYSIFSAWHAMGLIRKIKQDHSSQFEHSTRLSESAKAKCSCCGIIARATKSRFLKALECPKCKRKSWFVILTSAHVSEKAD